MVVSDDQKLQIQQATDIVRLIGEQVALRPKGKELAGLCPFHDDKNPSMSVSPQKQIFHCFVCGTGGDAYGWMMKYHKMSFPEAFEYLAQLAGIEIQPAVGRSMATGFGQDDRKSIFEANQLAVSFYSAMLRHTDHGRVAREYLQDRQISDEMIELFALGVAPDRWDGLVETIEHNKHWDRRSFESAGLITPREGSSATKYGSHYDRLRHRLIFPIFDAIGRPIAFGGRILPESVRDDAAEAKYLNSPETVLFRKSATLYGTHLAKKPIIDEGRAVVVEGYTDVIACHQAGAHNVVATLGTALTEDHIRELRRYADQVVLVFDADAAGRKAADRAVELFLTADVDVAVAVLPVGEDPDSLLHGANGVEHWRIIVDQATDALTYLFERMRQDLQVAETVTSRQKLASDYLNRIVELGLARAGSIRRTLVIGQLAEILGIGESQIMELLRASDRSRVQSSTFDEPVTQHTKAIVQAERQIIGGLIQQNELFHQTLADGRSLDEALPPSEFITAEHRDLYTRLYERLSDGDPIKLAPLLGELAQEQLTHLTAIVVGADAEIDQVTRASTQLTERVVVEAAEAILRFGGEQRYQQERRLVAAPDEADRLLEHRRAHPSPTKIMRR